LQWFADIFTVEEGLQIGILLVLLAFYTNQADSIPTIYSIFTFFFFLFLKSPLKRDEAEKLLPKIIS